MFKTFFLYIIFDFTFLFNMKLTQSNKKFSSLRNFCILIKMHECCVDRKGWEEC